MTLVRRWLFLGFGGHTGERKYFAVSGKTGGPGAVGLETLRRTGNGRRGLSAGNELDRHYLFTFRIDKGLTVAWAARRTWGGGWRFPATPAHVLLVKKAFLRMVS